MKLALAPSEQPTMTVQFESADDEDEDRQRGMDLYSSPHLFPKGAPDFE